MNDGFRIEIRGTVNDKGYVRAFTIDPLEIVLSHDPTYFNRVAEGISKQVLERVQTEITEQIVTLIKDHHERLFRRESDY